MAPKLLLLGTGWGGTSLLRALRTRKFDVTVVSRADHMLFTPLLASTATGALEHRSIIEPIRPLAAKRGAIFLNASATHINAAADKVHFQAPDFSFPLPTSGENTDKDKANNDGAGGVFEQHYDALVVSLGATVNTFGVPGVREFSFFMKEAGHARAVRKRMHDLFERAATPGHNAHQRRALLTFVVCGAGPTGVELTAEIGDWLRDIKRSAGYGALADEARVVLVEASGEILTAFDQNLRAYALRKLRDGRAEIKLGSAVKKVEKNAVVLQDSATGGLEERLPCGMVVWTAGVGPRPVVANSDLPKTVTNRILTDEYLLCKTPGSAPVIAMGDCASISGNELVPIAQVAEQQGIHVAEMFNRTKGLTAEELRNASEPFTFASKGMLAYVGGWKGVAKLEVHKKEKAESFKVRYAGFLAWVTWRLAYLSKLGSFRNKLQVPFDFVKTSLFGRDISSF